MTRLLPALLALAGLGASASGAAAQEPPFVLGEMVEVTLQQLYVTVTDRGGRRVVDLGEEAFHVVDEGVSQRIVTLEGGDLPVTAVLLLDGSRSMRGEPLDAARSGVEAFAHEMRELDEASVVVFSDRLLRRTPFASSPGQIVRGLDALEAVGGSAVHDHLYVALRMLEERLGRRVVILLSDGLDAHSVVTFDQLDRLARVSRSLVYWVRVRERFPPRAATSTRMSWVEPRQGVRDHHRLEKLVSRSGGRIVEIRALAEVEWAFREVVSELREQYAIGYYPDPPLSGSGRFRSVEVTVRAPGLRVRTREGYVDR